MNSGPRLHIIVGSTASGKERLALAYAERVGGEIVSVDSMKVYRSLDIATAKAGSGERGRVRHHCLDLVDPTGDFSAADYVRHAEAAIADIHSRGKIPVLSGGTALYYKALLDGLFEGPGADVAYRRELEEEAERIGVGGLHRRLAQADPKAAAKIHSTDLRRIVRALEIHRLTGGGISERQRQWAGFHKNDLKDGDGETAFFSSPRFPFVMFRIARKRDDVHRRIAERIERMAEAGLREEAKQVYDQRGVLSRTPLQAVGYKEFFPYFSGDETWEQALERLRLATNKLVRKQDTWFRKFPATAVELERDDEEGKAAALLSDSV